MSELTKILAGHPIVELPYTMIHYSHQDGQNKPIYVVAGSAEKAGAKLTLARAFKTYGGKCFHCGKKFKPEGFSQKITRDHIRPKSKGGGDYLHNLVIACGPCNKSKADKELPRCRVDATEKYLKALDAHLVKCIQAIQLERPSAPSMNIDKREPKPKLTPPPSPPQPKQAAASGP